MAKRERLAVELPKQTKAKLQKEAERRGVTMTSIIRELVERWLPSGQKPARGHGVRA